MKIIPPYMHNTIFFLWGLSRGNSPLICSGFGDMRVRGSRSPTRPAEPEPLRAKAYGLAWAEACGLVRAETDEIRRVSFLSHPPLATLIVAEGDIGSTRRVGAPKRGRRM